MAIAMLLYHLYAAGVPMSSSLALPVILAEIGRQKCKHLLHSKQTAHPLGGTMKSHGIEPEPGKMFWTRRVVNLFYQKIGLSMREGTKSRLGQEGEGSSGQPRSKVAWL